MAATGRWPTPAPSRACRWALPAGRTTGPVSGRGLATSAGRRSDLCRRLCPSPLDGAGQTAAHQVFLQHEKHDRHRDYGQQGCAQFQGELVARRQAAVDQVG